MPNQRDIIEQLVRQNTESARTIKLLADKLLNTSGETPVLVDRQPRVVHPLAPCNYRPEGFGRNINLNMNGVYFAKNLNASGDGSVLGAPSDHFVVRPGLRGKIEIPHNTEIRTDNRVLLGQSSDGIQIVGSLAIPTNQALIEDYSSNVYISHISFRAGETDGNSAGSHSAFDILGINGASVRNFVMVHCTMQHGDDNVFSIVGDVAGVSIIDCMIGLGPTNAQPSYPGVFQQADGVTFLRNLFSGKARMPRVDNCGKVDFTNNVTHSYNGPAFTSRTGNPNPIMQVNTEKNLMVSTLANSNSRHFYQEDVAGTLRVHIDDNQALPIDGDIATDLAPPGQGFYVNPVGAEVYSAARHDFGFEHAKLEHAALLAHVLAYCGSLPDSRDSSAQIQIDALANQLAIPEQTLVAGWGHPTIPNRAAPVANIFKEGEVDGIDPDVKELHGLDRNTNTTQTYTNGGRNSDWLAIFDTHIGL